MDLVKMENPSRKRMKIDFLDLLNRFIDFKRIVDDFTYRVLTCVYKRSANDGHASKQRTVRRNDAPHGPSNILGL